MFWESLGLNFDMQWTCGNHIGLFHKGDGKMCK